MFTLLALRNEGSSEGPCPSEHAKVSVLSKAGPIETISKEKAPNPFRMISFADPHTLNPVFSHLYKKQGGWGAGFNPVGQTFSLSQIDAITDAKN